MSENGQAQIVRGCWESLPGHYPNVSLDAFVVMPDHVHGIIVLDDTYRVYVGTYGARAGLKPAPTHGDAPANAGEVRHGLPEVVRALKTFSARRINAMRATPGAAVWQRGYHERVIRNERHLGRVRQYIRSNPSRWRRNDEHPNP